MTPEEQEEEKQRRGSFWIAWGLLVGFLGILPLMRHIWPDWPSLICFAVAAGLIYFGNRVRKTG